MASQIIDCPVSDCEGQHDVEIYEDTEGDPGVINTFITWEYNNPPDCGHDYGGMQPADQAVFDNAVDNLWHDTHACDPPNYDY